MAKPKVTEYLHIQGYTKADAAKGMRRFKATKKPSLWRNIRVIKNPDNALVRLLKGKDRKKYVHFCLTFRKTK